MLGRDLHFVALEILTVLCAGDEQACLLVDVVAVGELAGVVAVVAVDEHAEVVAADEYAGRVAVGELAGCSAV